MVRIVLPLLLVLARSNADDLHMQIEFLKAENELLRQRVPKKHIVLDPDERAKLLKLGKELGPGIRHVITIVSDSTFRRWMRKEEGKGPTRKGRPRLAAIVRQLVVMIAKEKGWGYSRILGEIGKLHARPICRLSVKNILIEHSLDPGPKRSKGKWCDFLRIHAETRWHRDFFSQQTWTLHGSRLVFALFFIHWRRGASLSRRTRFSPTPSGWRRRPVRFSTTLPRSDCLARSSPATNDGKFSKALLKQYYRAAA